MVASFDALRSSYPFSQPARQLTDANIFRETGAKSQRLAQQQHAAQQAALVQQHQQAAMAQQHATAAAVVAQQHQQHQIMAAQQRQQQKHQQQVAAAAAAAAAGKTGWDAIRASRSNSLPARLGRRGRRLLLSVFG